MSDEPKTWKLDGELAVASGAELLDKLEQLGVSRGVLAVGVSKFPTDDEGQIAEDVPAEKVAKAYFRHEYGKDGDYHILDHHKDMVKQICEKGEYTPPAEQAETVSGKFKGVKRIAKKKDEPKADGLKPAVVKAGKKGDEVA